MKYTLVAVECPTDFEHAQLVTQYKTYDVDEVAVAHHSTYELIGGYVTLDDGKKYWLHKPQDSGFVVKSIPLPNDSESDLVIRSWGDCDKYRNNSLNSDVALFRWIVNLFKYDEDLISLLSSEFKLRKRLDCFMPMRSKISPGKISIYKDIKMYMEDRQTVMKPGRALHSMFPELQHKQIITLGDSFLNKFSKRDLKLSVESDRDSFKLAYSGAQAATDNISTTYTRKSSSSSCMRYDFSHLKCHPVEAYASGDFQIIIVKDSGGFIAARCVVFIKSGSGVPQAGPIYGVSEQALDMIESHLLGIDADMSSPDWKGAKLVAIPEDEHQDPPTSFIGPYLDVEPRSLGISGCGKYLIQEHGGDIDANDYQGILGVADNQCTCCGDTVQEYDTIYSEYYDGECCEDCYHQNHFYCEYAQESQHIDDARTAYAMNRNGHKEELTVSSWAVEEGDMFVFTTSEEHWRIDDAVYCEADDVWVSPDCMDQYFTSDWDEELYQLDVMCVTTDGESVSKYELDSDSNEWKLNSQCLWEKEEEEEEE